MIIKCKMCGGDLEFRPGATYGTCEYCGSTSTIPQADEEGKLNRYNRANHFRRQCEFDKAVAAYEKLLEQDDTDAEAHWGAVISRYGIEYVEDPATRRRVPTCHRLQVASILADADYLAAVENAPDAASRDLYEQQAAEIAGIQKDILAISANEKPYDVFICYKETDENGQRTRDSQWAQDVYYGLTEQGYKVFFSRITLEDKLGQQYEPYIFAALNSAKVMAVIGSKPEYFNAVWVRNEWSRYLALMAKDRKRLLIPCYRDMDPYDLPEELSSLQSQDMGRIGFMQDLLRGVKKVLDAGEKTEQPGAVRQVVQTTASDTGSPGVASLMKRVRLFMENGDFRQASEYLDRVLDIDPECASAYAAKVCVAFGIRKEADLANATFQFDDNADWQKALRFADARQKAAYEGCAARVKERVAVQARQKEEKARREAEAAAAKKKRNTILGVIAAIVIVAAVLFVTQVCLPEQNRANTYTQAQAFYQKGDYSGAYALYATIKGYKDVDNLLVSDQNLTAAAAATRALYTKVGNIVTYGHYEQDNNTGNGKEAIEWIVLAYDSASGKSLLISRYGLDARRFDASKYQGWDKSEIRGWLNSTFLNNAFTAKEQEGIVTTRVSTPEYKGYSGGSDTQDKLWLLSRGEANTYFKNGEARKAIPTGYAVAQGAYQYNGSDSGYKLNGAGCCWWWLRSPGRSSISASGVRYDGSLLNDYVYYTDDSVRPAFWLNLDSADIY